MDLSNLSGFNAQNRVILRNQFLKIRFKRRNKKAFLYLKLKPISTIIFLMTITITSTNVLISTTTKLKVLLSIINSQKPQNIKYQLPKLKYQYDDIYFKYLNHPKSIIAQVHIALKSSRF